MFGHDFKDVIIGFVIVGVIIGSIVTTLVIFGVPYVWGFVKPWLHAISS